MSAWCPRRLCYRRTAEEKPVNNLGPLGQTPLTLFRREATLISWRCLIPDHESPEDRVGTGDTWPLPCPPARTLSWTRRAELPPGVDASALPGGGSTSCRSTWGSTRGCCSNTTFRESQPGARGKHSGPMVRRSGPAVPQEGSRWTSVALASPASRPSCRITAPTTSFVGGHVIRVLLWRQPRPGRLTSCPGIWVLSRDTHALKITGADSSSCECTKEGNQCLSALSGPLAAWVLIPPKAWLFTFHSVVWTNSYSSSKCPHPSSKLAIKPTSIIGNQKPPKGISSNPPNNLICHYYPYFNVR